MALPVLVGLLWVLSHVAPDGCDVTASHSDGGGATAWSVAVGGGGNVSIARVSGPEGALVGDVWRGLPAARPSPKARERITTRNGLAVNGWALTLPIWPLIVIASLLPAVWVREALRAHSRPRRAYTCPQCKYDLCGSLLTGRVDRCPECGWQFVRLR